MSVLSALHGATSTVFSNLFVRLPIPSATPDLSQQTIIVTGANTGLGLETSRHLLRLGVGKLIMAVRSPSKGSAAKHDLLTTTGCDPSTIEVWPLDMASYHSVKAFAARASSELSRLDGVLANAGILTRQFALSPETGHESTLTVNVISTFLLCLLLLSKLRDTHAQTGRAPRFVIPNSALHYLAPMGELTAAEDGSIIARLDDPAKADMAGRYPVSKLLVLYAVRELAGRCRAAAAAAAAAAEGGGVVGAKVIINTPNPSYCVSGLMREDGGVGVKVAERLLARTTEEGARTLYHGLVVAGEESDGQYLTNCHVQT